MYYEYKGIKIHYVSYKKEDNEKTILILPGWGETRKTFDHFISYFKERYNIYIVDYPGFGESPIPDFSLTIYDYSLLVKHFLEDQQLKNPFLIAHSFGGRIATILTGHFQVPIQKMVFMDVAGIKPRKTFFQILKEKTYRCLKFFCLTFSRKKKKERLAKLRKIFASSDYRALDQKMLTTFRNIIGEDLKKYYPHISSEVLLLWGKRDMDTPLKDARYMEKSIPDSSLIVFEDGGHFTYLEYAYAVHLIVESFFEEE